MIIILISVINALILDIMGAFSLFHVIFNELKQDDLSKDECYFSE